MLFSPKMLYGIEGTHNAVFMKTIAPVCATKIGPVHAIDFWLSLLSQHAFGGKNRMVINHAFDDFFGGNPPAVIECDTKLCGGLNVLQDIQVVGQGNSILLLGRNMIVPAPQTRRRVGSMPSSVCKTASFSWYAIGRNTSCSNGVASANS